MAITSIPCHAQGQLKCKSGFERGVSITSDYGDLRGFDGMDWHWPEDISALCDYPLGIFYAIAKSWLTIME
jgi:hypothetical protein